MAIKATNQITVIDVTDAYSVMLTSESFTFQGNATGTTVGLTCNTEVVAYCGSTPCSKVSITASQIKCPTGISATVSNNNTVSPMVTFKTTAVVKDACEATIPVVVDGIVINKKFSFSVAKSGAIAAGGNLIRNGYGEYLDNTNFSGGVFTKGDCPDGAFGYFTYGVTESIPFDPTKIYDLEFYVRLHNGKSGSNYFSIDPRDIDNFPISYYNVLNYNQNLFYLAKDLNKGDTVVYFKDLSKWNVNTTQTYHRSFLFFGYKDSTGYVYPDGTYSRNFYKYVYSDNSSINLTDNTITLKQAWSGATYKAGTCVGQVSDGSTYCYYGQSGTITNTDWRKRNANVYAGTGGGNYSIDDRSRRLLYAKYIFVNLYNNTADYSKLSLKEQVVKSIVSEVEEYYKSTSATTLSGGSWSKTYPGWESGKYIWTRTVTTFTDKSTTTTTPKCVTGQKGDTGTSGKDGKMLYATSSTASGTAAKVATISPTTTFSLYTGATVSVCFSNANTASNPTLNVNGTGANPIYAFGASLTTVYYWKAKSTVQFVYNGTAWVMNADYAMSLAAQWAHDKDTTYINGSKIYAGSIGTIQLAANSITSDKIAAKAITAAKIDVDDLFSKSITATNMTIEGDSVFKGRIDGASGTFSGNIKAKTIEISSTDLIQIGSIGKASASLTIDNEGAIIRKFFKANADDTSYDVVSIETGTFAFSGENYHASCELIADTYNRSDASGEILTETSMFHIDPLRIMIQSNRNIELISDKISFNGTDWDTFKTQHPYDWSTFGTENNTNTWMPVVNGERIYHRAVAATMSQANYWTNGTNQVSCIRLSNDIVMYFVKAVSPTTVDVTTAAAKGYRSREYTYTFPNSIKTILYASSYVENSFNWENVEFKIHSISDTYIKSHFWCQNAYSGLSLYWYLMIIAQM